MFLIFSFVLFAIPSSVRDVLPASTRDQEEQREEHEHVFSRSPNRNHSALEKEHTPSSHTQSKLATWFSPQKNRSNFDEQSKSIYTSGIESKKLFTEEVDEPAFPLNTCISQESSTSFSSSNTEDFTPQANNFNEQLDKMTEQGYQFIFTRGVEDPKKKYEMLKAAAEIQQNTAVKIDRFDKPLHLQEVKGYIPKLIESCEAATGHLWEICVNGVTVFIYTVNHYGNQVEKQIAAINQCYLYLLEAFIVDGPKLTPAPAAEDKVNSEVVPAANQKQACMHKMEEEIKKQEKEARIKLEQQEETAAPAQRQAQAKRKTEEEAAQSERARQIEKSRIEAEEAIARFIDQETKERNDLQSAETTARNELNAKNQKEREEKEAQTAIKKKTEEEEAAIIAEAQAKRQAAAEKIKKFFRQIIQKRAEAATRIATANRKTEEEAAQAERARQIEESRIEAEEAITRFIAQEIEARNKVQDAETTARPELNAQKQAKKHKNAPPQTSPYHLAHRLPKFGCGWTMVGQGGRQQWIFLFNNQLPFARLYHDLSNGHSKKRTAHHKLTSGAWSFSLRHHTPPPLFFTTYNSNVNPSRVPEVEKTRTLPDPKPEGKADKHVHKSMSLQEFSTTPPIHIEENQGEEEMDELFMHFASRYLHTNPDPLANGNSMDPRESDDDDEKAYLPWALGPLYPEHPQADNTDSGRNKTKWPYTVPAPHSAFAAFPYNPALKLIGSSCGWLSPWMSFSNHQFLLRQLYNDWCLRHLFDQRAMVQILNIPTDGSSSNPFSGSMKIPPVFASQAPTYVPDFLTQNCWKGESRPSSEAATGARMYAWKAQQFSRSKLFDPRLAACFPLLAAAYMLSPSTDHQAK